MKQSNLGQENSNIESANEKDKEDVVFARVVVSKKKRGKELGKKIMISSIEYIKKNLKCDKIELETFILFNLFAASQLAKYFY